MNVEPLELMGDVAMAGAVAVCVAWVVTKVFRRLSATGRRIVWLLALMAPVIAGIAVLRDAKVNAPTQTAEGIDEFAGREAVATDIPAERPPVDTFRSVEAVNHER